MHVLGGALRLYRNHPRASPLLFRTRTEASQRCRAPSVLGAKRRSWVNLRRQPAIAMANDIQKTRSGGVKPTVARDLRTEQQATVIPGSRMHRPASARWSCCPSHESLFFFLKN